MRKLFKYTALLVIGFMVSCQTDDYTGYSDLTPTNPTITVSGIPSDINFVEKDSVFEFTVTLSEAQLVDVQLKIKQVDGTATEGEDFVILNDGGNLTIPAHSTTGKVKIKILADDIKEDTETAVIQIGDETTANATIEPVQVTFNIQNLTGDDLVVSMAWDGTAYDQYGNKLDPTDIADMVLAVYDASNVLVDEADGAAFEELALSGSLPDGQYFVRAAFYAVTEFPEPVELAMSIGFYQVGVQDVSLSVEGLVNTGHYKGTFNLVKITKAGSTWTFEKDPYIFVNLPDFAGVYGGADGSIGSGYNWRFDNPVTITVNGSEAKIEGLNFAWMEYVWGETITTSTPVTIQFNNDGTLTIAEQYYITTDYEGAPYDYTIVGEGYFTLSDPIKLHIEYKMLQDGFDVAGWLLSKGYSDTDYFIADLEWQSASKTSYLPSVVKPNVKIVKPY